MVKTSGVVSFVMPKLLFWGLLTLPMMACSGSSSDGNGNAGGAGIVGSAGTTAGDPGSSGATSSPGSSGATGSSGAPGSAGATAGGNPDFVAACNSFVTAECHQIYACVPATDIATDPTDFGTSEADCGTVEGQAAGCDAGVSPCDPGFNFDAAQFKTCVAAFNALSCDDFMTVIASPSGAPDECSTVCTQ